MSKVWKGIKKVFKKVVKVVKKVVPIILAAAAIYFTAGAALAGGAGWGSVASGLTSSLGTGVVGTTVTGALTSAGYGAAIGGIVSKASGGSFTEGAQAGALSGAVTGGIMSYAGYTPPADAGIAQAEGATTFAMPETPVLGEGTYIDAAGNAIPAPATTGPVFDGPWAPGVTPPPGANTGVVPGGVDPAVLPKPQQTVPEALPVQPPSPQASVPQHTVPEAAADSATKGGLIKSVLGKDGWLQRNQTLAGGAISGLGQGMMANAAADASLEMQDKISANYEGADPGRGYRKLAGSDSRRDRYDPRSYGSWEYQYDPAQGRIIKVPVGG